MKTYTVYYNSFKSFAQGENLVEAVNAVKDRLFPESAQATAQLCEWDFPLDPLQVLGMVPPHIVGSMGHGEALGSVHFVIVPKVGVSMSYSCFFIRTP